MLSSFIGIKRKPKPTKQVFTNTAQRVNPTPPATFHPFTDADLFNLADQPAPSSSQTSLPIAKPVSLPDPIDDPPPRPSLSSYPSQSPKVQLNLELSSEPIDWFGGNFLQRESVSLELKVVSGPRGSTGAVEDGAPPRVRPPTATSVSSGDTRGRVNGRQLDSMISVGSKRSEIESLQTPITATNGTMEHIQSQPPDTPSRLPPPLPKKPTPPAIKIPNTGIISKKVESPELSRQPSIASSIISDSELSAVSGTTLARAILGNTFVLSADTRLSRHRSGMSLTRADSATLPRDNMYLASPYWREGSIASPVSGGILSPVPPIPLDAGQVYIPPRTPRQASTNRTDIRPPDSRKKVGRIAPESDLAITHLNAATTISETQAARRISRISEASTTPSTPETLNASDAQQRTVLNGVGYSPPFQPQEDSPVESLIPESPNTPQDLRTPLPKVPASPQQQQQQPRPTSAQSLPEGSFTEGQDVDTPTSTVPHSPGYWSISETSSATREIGDVLDYYAFTITPEPTHLGFRPQFSPISEESISQLSPQSFERKRESQRSLASIITLPSARSREWTISRKQSITDASPPRRPLLPIGERPQSLHTSSTSSTAGSTPYSNQHAVGLPNGAEAPSLVSKVFNRQRSGSAPSPIRVTRNPREKNYNISVGPLTVDVRPPGTGDHTQQTFPETPSAFSPMWTPSSVSPSTMPAIEAADFLAFLPVTPGMSRKESLQRSLSQRVLLSRAGSIARARSHRQASLKARLEAPHPYTRPRPTSLNMDLPVAVGSKSASEDGLSAESALKTERLSSAGSGMIVDLTFGSSLSESTEGNNAETDGFPKDVSRDSILSTDFSSLYNFSPFLGPQHSPRSRVVSLALDPLESAPTSPTQSGPPSASPPSSPGFVAIHSNANASSTSPPSPQQASNTSSFHVDSSPIHTPSHANLLAHSRSSSATAAAPQTPMRVLTSQSSSSTLSYMTNPSVERLPPIANGVSSTSDTSSSSHADRNVVENSNSPVAATPGSPPPYETIVSEHGHGGNLTPNTASSQEVNGRTPPQLSPFTPSSAHSQPTPQSQAIIVTQASGPTGLSRTLSGTRRQLVRPPLPFGPRRPSQNAPVAAVNIDNHRERNPSVSSITSNTPTGRRLRTTTTPSPRFQTPPVKWRGYTLEAAKWTFTSAQLQNIVSRAVKQSAEPSTIRLLQLETLDQDIPEELNRLEMHRTDVKTRYKMLARRRAHLLETLLAQYDGTETEDPSFSLRLVEELKDISITLDKAAEELHSLDEQLAQLSLLCEVHTSSALAMALRKLNTSLMKQFSENQAMKEHIDLLEDEKDVAWKQAQDVADDYDILTEKMRDGSTSPQSRRSSRVSAARKSSVRAAKAGLRSSGMRSARSSMSSNSHRISSASMHITSAVEEIPPVPPIPPRKRPNNIVTDMRRISRISQGLSTDGFTPNSETRALFRAQEELYEMLGIPLPEKRVQRTRSLIARGPEEESYSQLASAISPRLSRLKRRSSVLGLVRPTSLPGDSVLSEVYNAMTADQQAMLTTLNLMSAAGT